MRMKKNRAILTLFSTETYSEKDEMREEFNSLLLRHKGIK